MKILLYELTFFLTLTLTGFNYGTYSHNSTNVNVSNRSKSFVNRKNVNPLWITYNPTLINMTHTYDFDTIGEPFSNGQHYSSSNPDYNLIVAIHIIGNTHGLWFVCMEMS